ncbi:hypothetical protein BCR35DRAFT_351957 [Leucosporidium creatinivorum]|uniref:Uncharacterized protein n=1 Tax=Leucosporidium creatinivorum TaxID=106004 RepID=A0A1Y2FIQ6_9BASI|nr:hypothetical protein BCR35DRAFT_351957 [Leucosporidium creatinivorum]
MGGLAYIVGAAVLIWLLDSVATANFLTEREKIVALGRVRDNQTGTRNKQLKRYQVIEALTDPKTWLLLLLTAPELLRSAIERWSGYGKASA